MTWERYEHLAEQETFITKCFNYPEWWSDATLYGWSVVMGYLDLSLVKERNPQCLPGT